MKMFSRILALVVLVIAATLFVDQSTAAAKGDRAESAMTPCLVGRTAPPVGFWTWPANTRVNIYLREPDFSESDVSAVRLAVQNWDATTMENGSNVRFIFQGLTPATRTGQGEVTIVRKAVSEKNRQQRAVLQAHSLQSDRFIDYALMLVDPSVTNAGMLTSVVAHELGHSLGLMDCYKCNSRSTAMGLLKAGESNGIEGPTACDKREVMAAYEGLKPRSMSPSSLALALNKPQENQAAELGLAARR